MPSWGRRPGESEVAYEAFKTFLALEGRRSFRAVGRKLAKSSTLIDRWAKQFNWLDRTRDYDSNKERLLLQTEIAEEKRRRRQVITQKHKIGLHLESLAIKALAKLAGRLDEDEGMILFPNAIIQLLELGYALQEADYPEHAKEQSGQKGISALAESIRALACKTIEDSGGKRAEGA